MQGGSEAGRECKEEARQEEVASLISSRIQKATLAQPTAQTKWITELPRTTLSQFKGPKKRLYETGLCMQALYDRDREPTDVIEDTGNISMLENSSLIFLEMFIVYQKCERKSISWPAVTSYNSLPGRLPDWFAFPGAIVLIPCKSQDVEPRYPAKSKSQVNNELKGMYGRRGYQVWRERFNTEVKPGGFDLLLVAGRHILHGTASWPVPCLFLLDCSDKSVFPYHFLRHFLSCFAMHEHQCMGCNGLADVHSYSGAAPCQGVRPSERNVLW